VALWVPRLFLPSVIRLVVAPGQPGAYALGNDRHGFVAGYVGRSDTCLRSRLANHNHLYAFEYFVFRYSDGPEEAFAAECELYHVYRQLGVPLRNQVHPALPATSADRRCPYCGFVSRWRRYMSGEMPRAAPRPPGAPPPRHRNSSPLSFAHRPSCRCTDSGGIVRWLSRSLRRSRAAR
jgi:hypothetical protein